MLADTHHALDASAETLCYNNHHPASLAAGPVPQNWSQSTLGGNSLWCRAGVAPACAARQRAAGCQPGDWRGRQHSAAVVRHRRAPADAGRAHRQVMSGMSSGHIEVESFVGLAGRHSLARMRTFLAVTHAEGPGVTCTCLRLPAGWGVLHFIRWANTWAQRATT